MMKKKSAWVVTWESLSQDCPDLPERIISIRDGRTSPERIREFIEQHYMATQYSLREKILFSSHPKNNPYPAEYDKGPSGIKRLGVITCGDHPFILARIVKNIRFYEDREGDTMIEWD